MEGINQNKGARERPHRNLYNVFESFADEVEPQKLFHAYFEKLPSIYKIEHLDVGKASVWIEDNFRDMIIDAMKTVVIAGKNQRGLVQSTYILEIE